MTAVMLFNSPSVYLFMSQAHGAFYGSSVSVCEGSGAPRQIAHVRRGDKRQSKGGLARSMPATQASRGTQ